MIHIVYKTINLLNNKIYVGKHSTHNINDGYYGSGKLIKQSIKKNGIENFKVEILEYCTKDSLDEREIFWINKLNSRDLTIGYNLNSGGTGFSCGDENPMRKNKELLKKHSNRMKIDNPMMDNNIAKKVGDSLKGKLAGKNNPMYGKRLGGSKNGFYGKSHSDETKSKLRKIHGHSVIVDGVEYDSMNVARKELGIDRGTVYNRCKSEKWPTYLFT